MAQLETIRNYWNTRADGYSRSVMEEMEDAQKEGTYWNKLIILTECWRRQNRTRFLSV